MSFTSSGALTWMVEAFKQWIGSTGAFFRPLRSALGAGRARSIEAAR